MTQRILAHLPDDDLAAVHEAAGDGGSVTRAKTLDALFDAISGKGADLTIVSLDMDHVDESVLERIAETSGAGSLLLASSGASLHAALLAERLGAIALARQPLAVDELREHLGALTDEGPAIELPSVEGDLPALVGQSASMADVFGMIAKVARSASTVLITGESGTGKEVVARTLHEQSPRRDGPFVAVNCAAIPEQLLESELFGHEKGAFTGAVGKRAGRFQRANGGTLFLDEIGDMSLVLQAKVLRALEERQVERVGGQGSEAVDVRVIAATNQRLAEAIEDGRFREDLFYRLAVVEIDLPPLRERGSDVRLLALHFAALFSAKHGRNLRGVSTAAMKRIEQASWPGNVRELRNVMDRAVLLTTGDVVRSGALRLGPAAPRTSSTSDATAGSGYPPTASLADVEADHIRKVLGVTDGHIGRAAEVLGIHRNTLSRKIQDYGLDPSAPTGGR